MAFSNVIRREALVASARRCCLCRRYNGVGVEVHHIVPQSSGGKDDMTNAIVLCFDCHCAAGHYNAEHPRGTKYRPDELRRHRDEWNERVRTSGLESTADDEFTEYYARHLICLDNNAAIELITQERENIPFSYQYVLDNHVRAFMEKILNDKLPHTWASSDSKAGYFWGPHYDDIDELFDAHPEFGGKDSRALCADDFSQDGLVPSQTYKELIEGGMKPSDLGKVEIENGGCGDGAMIYVALRRPLFVFAELKNTSSLPMVFDGIIARRNENHEYLSSLESWDDGELQAQPLGNLTLNPGEVVIIPECVLLSDIEHDDYSTDYTEWTDISSEQGQAIGFRNDVVSREILTFGPSVRLRGFDITVNRNAYSIPIHSFELNKCYLFFRAWMCGSCPHLYLRHVETGWRYFGELFSDSDGKIDIEETIKVPDGIDMVSILESDFEVTKITQIELGVERLLAKKIQLKHGDIYQIPINEPCIIRIVGHYEAPIHRAQNYLQLRQQRSFRKMYERDFFDNSKCSTYQRLT